MSEVRWRHQSVMNDRVNASSAFLGSLASGLAHEVKNPLSTMTITLGLMREDIEGSEARRDRRMLKKVQLLEGEVARLEHTIQEFLQFAGRHTVRPTLVQLGVWLSRLLNVFEPSLATSHIRLRRELAPKLPAVLVDCELMQQMILNLLTNARQAMPKGGELTVRARSTGDRVQIDVSDTGEGIAPDVLPRIWEVYFSAKDHGTGLGLPTVRRIVAEHGGDVSVITTPGKGSCFSVSLPLPPKTTSYPRMRDRLVRALQGALRPHATTKDSWILPFSVSAKATNDVGSVTEFLEFVTALESLLGATTTEIERIERGSLKGALIALFRGARREEIETTLEQLAPKAIDGLVGKLELPAAQTSEARAQAELAAAQALAVRSGVAEKQNAAEYDLELKRLEVEERRAIVALRKLEVVERAYDFALKYSKEHEVTLALEGAGRFTFKKNALEWNVDVRPIEMAPPETLALEYHPAPTDKGADQRDQPPSG